MDIDWKLVAPIAGALVAIITLFLKRHEITSLKHKKISDRLVSSIQYFEKYYEIFCKDGNLSGIKDEYEKLLVNRNKEVYIIEGDSRIKRVAIGIDTDGELLVKDDNGKIEKIMAGEVSIRGIYGYV